MVNLKKKKNIEGSFFCYCFQIWKNPVESKFRLAEYPPFTPNGEKPATFSGLSQVIVTSFQPQETKKRLK